MVFEEVKLHFVVCFSLCRMSKTGVLNLVGGILGIVVNGHVATAGNQQGAKPIHKEL